MLETGKTLLVQKTLLTEKDLHSYQQFCVDFVEDKPQCALFLDCGLGKTVIALTAISHLLYDSFEVSRVLIIAPLRVARDTWIAELDKWEHLKGLRMERVIGTEKDRVAALSRRAELYVINRENVEWLVKHYAGRRLPFDISMQIGASRGHNGPLRARACLFSFASAYYTALILLGG